MIRWSYSSWKPSQVVFYMIFHEIREIGVEFGKKTRRGKPPSTGSYCLYDYAPPLGKPPSTGFYMVLSALSAPVSPAFLQTSPNWCRPMFTGFCEHGSYLPKFNLFCCSCPTDWNTMISDCQQYKRYVFGTIAETGCAVRPFSLVLCPKKELFGQ